MLRCARVLCWLPLALANPWVDINSTGSRPTCTVTAQGNKTDDVPNLLFAFEQCGRGGNIVFPKGQNYWIAQRLNPVVEDVDISWQGQWTFSDNLTYWRANHYPIAFQNHAASFILTGSSIRIDGGPLSSGDSSNSSNSSNSGNSSESTPQIHGNGDTWYTAEAGTVQPGRPMPFVLWNVSDALISNFYIKDPPLWALNIMNGTDLHFRNIKVNATATKAPHGTNWVANTDGFDTMDVRNVTLENLWYQGGDDCVAIKPRSYGVTVRGAYCHGGNGIAIGSLGQYAGEDASVEDVLVDDVDVVRYNEDMHGCAYVKTWIGVPVPQASYESGGVPRGGGTGVVRNVTMSNFRVQGADGPPAITEDSGNNGSFSGSSKMLASGVRFANFSGWLNNKTTKGSVSCSSVQPCFDVFFDNVHLRRSENGTENANGTCKYVKPGGVHGLMGSGC